MSTAKILAFSGSARRGSWNQRLVEVAAQGARDAGAQVTVINLADYPLPLFDEDLERESGTPENATRLKEIFIEHQGLLLASPEYNSSVTPLLKNTIDWISRRAGDEAPLVAFRGKFAALMSASPGVLGGLRGLVHIRAILGNIGVIVLPDQVAVPKAGEAFTAEGQLIESRQDEAIRGLGATLCEYVSRE